MVTADRLMPMLDRRFMHTWYSITCIILCGLTAHALSYSICIARIISSIHIIEMYHVCWIEESPDIVVPSSYTS